MTELMRCSGGRTLHAGSAADAEPGSTYPAAGDVVAFLRMRLPRLAHAADPAKPLALPPRAFGALVAFLRRCRAEERARGSGDGAGGHGDVDMLSGAPAELPGGYLGAAPDVRAAITGRWCCAAQLPLSDPQ